MNVTRQLPASSCLVETAAPTPLLEVRLDDVSPAIWCKLEYLNPSGSTKDRIAAHILSKAWRRGVVGPGTLVCEASSGSTSIAMAMVCAQLGLRFIAVMPSGVSNERVLMIKAFGGEVRLSPAERGILGSIALSEQIANEQGAFLPRQFENPDNAEAHRYNTAREILTEIPGRNVDVVISGVGTGGTLVGLYLGCRDAGCDPTPVFACPVKVEGDPTYEHGCFAHAECCSFSPAVPGVMDGMSKIFADADLPGLMKIEVEDRRALEVTRRLIRRGFPVGPSSGLNMAAAIEAVKQLPPGSTAVTVFPDRMERYFSTPLFTCDDSGAPISVSEDA
jgi:cysteine synthase A